MVSQLLMMSPKLPKIPILYVCQREGEAKRGGDVPTFDAQSQTTKTPNSLCPVWWGGGLGPMSELLMMSPNLLKSKNPYIGGGGGVPTFDAESKAA